MPSNPSDIRDRLIELVEPVCRASGYELVDLRHVLEQGGWVVRVFIDRDPPGGPDPISFEDCERVSRELSALFDVEDPIPNAYRLEVSSPGVDRPLRTAEHFRRQIGNQAKLTLDRGIDGRRNFSGTVIGVDDDDVIVEVDGTRHALPLSDISTAKLVPDWDAIMRT
jgi:ribosome maturation factor RimP